MAEATSSSPNSQPSPTITVAMPIYNAGAYLRMAVLSIVRQTERNWELLIIDDGSTDNALASIGDIADPRIRILQDGSNKGLAQRLNEAIDLARGQYLARMDQDDVSYPERLARQLQTLQKEPTLDLLATRAITIDEHNRATGIFPYALAHEEICARPWRGFYLPHPSWMGKIGWFRRYRYLVPGPYFCEDQELLLRAYRTSRFATLNEVLFAYRIRQGINWPKLLKTRTTVLRIQRDYFIENRQWSYLVRALMTTLARVVADGARFATQVLPRRRRHTMTPHLSTQWQNVLRDVSDGPVMTSANVVTRSAT